MRDRRTQLGHEDEDTTDKLTKTEIDALLSFGLDDLDQEVSLMRNTALFHAWVPQPSPCCAAAVLAGALNALTPTHTWSHHDILPYYVEMTESRLATQRKRLLALMTTLMREAEQGTAAWSSEDLNKFTAAVHNHLRENYGTELGSTERNGVKLTKSLLLKAARECMDSGWSVVRSVLFPGITDGTSEEKEILQLRRRKQCEQELYEYLHLVDGRDKLLQAKRPSTSICGNAALVFAVAEIVKRQQERVLGHGTTSMAVRGELVMGLQAPDIKCVLKADDNVERREEAWNTLWRAFDSAMNVLVFHLKNHYALCSPCESADPRTWLFTERS